MKSALTIFRTALTGKLASASRMCYWRCYSTEKLGETQKKIHPYRQIHPWKSENEFANYLLQNVIYNADGIIAINKPYGISINNLRNKESVLPLNNCHKIVGAANYSVEDVLPYLAKELDVPILIPTIGSEKYMSGIYIFGINDDVCKNIMKARRRSINERKKYWAVTIRIPHEIKGKYYLGMTLQQSSVGNKKPVILTKWSKNAEKRKEVKILNIDYRVISNSTHNLSSLIEIEASTRKWHGIRLFASTMLYSPILGDNYHGSRVQEIMGTWIKVNPFAESSYDMPTINRHLLELLNIKPDEQEIIPAHVHLRSIPLMHYGKERKNIMLEAPLIPPFDWTCKQLLFQNIPYEVNNTITEDKVNITSI